MHNLRLKSWTIAADFKPFLKEFWRSSEQKAQLTEMLLLSSPQKKKTKETAKIIKL